MLVGLETQVREQRGRSMQEPSGVKIAALIRTKLVSDVGDPEVVGLETYERIIFMYWIF